MHLTTGIFHTSEIGSRKGDSGYLAGGWVSERLAQPVVSEGDLKVTLANARGRRRD